MFAVKLALGLLFVFFIITFASKNQQEAEMFYYFGYHYATRMWALVLASFALGVILTGLGSGYYFIKEKNTSWRLSKKVKSLETQIRELKQKPLPDMPGVYPPPRHEGQGAVDSDRIKVLTDGS